MSTIEKQKILVIALPKSGTSTLATMLRILDYQVTGPNPYVSAHQDLQKIFEEYEAFQDYPWCFEYPFVLKNKEVKIILLKRDKERWAKSFKESYSGENENHLSYRYMRLSKNASDNTFYSYHTNYYQEALNYIIAHNLNFIEISLIELNWKIICDFLGKPIPKNIFGITPKIPRVNSKNYQRKGVVYKLTKQLKKYLHSLLGRKYFKLTSFIYKNK